MDQRHVLRESVLNGQNMRPMLITRATFFILTFLVTVFFRFFLLSFSYIIQNRTKKRILPTSYLQTRDDSIHYLFKINKKIIRA